MPPHELTPRPLHHQAPAPPQPPPVLLLQYETPPVVEQLLQYLHRCRGTLVNHRPLHHIGHTLTPPVGVNPHLPPQDLLLQLRPLHPLLVTATPTIPAPLQMILNQSTLSTRWTISHHQMSTDTSLRFTPVKPPE